MKIDGLNKQLFFLMALPRSGNTLFGSLMNQNPDIGVTTNSITLNQFSVNGLSYDDNIIRNKIYTIKTEIKKEDNLYKSMIPESIRKAYGHIVL